MRAPRNPIVELMVPLSAFDFNQFHSVSDHHDGDGGGDDERILLALWVLLADYMFLILSSIHYLEKPQVFLLSRLLKSVLEMLEDIEGAGFEDVGTLEQAHISMFLNKNKKWLVFIILKRGYHYKLGHHSK